MNKLSLIKTIDLITLSIIVLGALYLGYNGVTSSKNKPIMITIYVLILLSALFHILNRNYYLPFLGDSAFPCGSLVEKIPTNANTQVSINTGVPNANVIYWASESADKTQENPWIAYGKNTNAGVAVTDSTGYAVLNVRNPAKYQVGLFHHELPKHIHYRVCIQSGMLGKVQTINI